MKTLLALLLLVTQSLAATYYISWDDGTDTNNGLGADASHGTNKPWKTFAKFASTAASGDVGYFAPGVYRETISLSQTWTSEVIFRGDPQNTRGFKSSGGVLTPSNAVILTSFTTNDTTAGAAAAVFDVNGKDYVTLEDIALHATKSYAAFSFGTGCEHMTLRRVTMQTWSYCIQGTLSFGQVADLLVENCVLVATGTSGSNPISIVHTSGTGSDWNPQIDVFNSILISNGYNALGYLKSGGSANVAGGMTITGCTLIAGGYIVDVGNSSTTLPWTLRNNYMRASDKIYSGQSAAQVDSNYNLCYAANANTNANFGANDQTAWSDHTDFGASQLFGLAPTGKPMFSLWPGSPLISGGTGSTPGSDLFSRDRSSTVSRGALELYRPLSSSSAQ